MTMFTLLLGLAAATSVSPVQKVIQLLDDLKGKVEADLERETKLMEEYTSWCDEEDNAKEDAITSSKRTIGDLMATIEDSKGQIATLGSTIEETTSKISSSEADLAEATALRKKENGDFAASEKELVDTVDSLGRAVALIKRNLGLLQDGKASKELSAVAASLSKVVEASWVTSHQKKVLQSLLQSQSADTDEDLSFAPQASTASYGGHSDGIVDTLSDMEEKAESSLSSTRKDEMEAAHAFAMLKQSLEGELKVMKKQLSEATLQKSSTEEALHAAEGELAETEKTLAADTTYLEELKASCSAKAAEWATRQKDAGAEMGAIAKAKEILAEGVKVFLQTSSKTLVTVHASGSRVRSQAVKVLKGLANKYKTFGLIELSSRAQSDPFGKIRGLIESMIGKLEKEAAEEADQKSFCDEEISESKAKQAKLQGGLDQQAARIAKAEANKAKLLEDIKLLEEQVAEIDAAQAAATKVRGEEHDDYLKASSDFKDSAEAVAKAVEVLNEYYTSASFVQVKQAPELGGAQTDIGSTITSMLEAAEEDFAKLLAETEAAEAAALNAFEKLSQDNKVSKTTKQGDVKGKTAEVKQIEVALSNYKEDDATLSDELSAVLTYLDKLKPQCETKVMSFAERKARREEEISGLKEALAILSEESFVQVSTSLRGTRRA
jgi:chromosome segregation ATPase